MICSKMCSSSTGSATRCVPVATASESSRPPSPPAARRSSNPPAMPAAAAKRLRRPSAGSGDGAAALSVSGAAGARVNARRTPAKSQRRRSRELALQVALQVTDIAHGRAPQLKTVVAIGGVSINPQMMALRGGAHLVVATPGRLLDLMDHRALRLGEVDLLVLKQAGVVPGDALSAKVILSGKITKAVTGILALTLF